MPSSLPKFVEAESRMVDAGGTGETEGVGMGSCCVLGTEFQFCKMKRALEMGRTTV